MKTLTLIRHTRPDISPGMCYGQMEVEVAASFAEEAAVLAACLNLPELIITSPLRRTHRLAAYLAQVYGCELRSDAGLMEMNFGDWEGRAWGVIPRGEIDAWSADLLHYTPPNGESAQQLLLRVQTLLQTLAKLPHNHIALVAHGGSIRAVLALIAAIPLAQTLSWQIEYGAVIDLKLPA